MRNINAAHKTEVPAIRLLLTGQGKRLIIPFRILTLNQKVVLPIVICPNCGKNTPEGKFCEHCGASVQSAQTFQQQPAAAQPAFTQQPAPPARAEKSSGLAAILSFLFTGSGQVYNGQLGRGIGFFVGALIGYMIFVIPGVIVWIYGIYDAYTTAAKMNKGEIPYAETNWGMVIGYIVVLIIVAVIFFLFIAAMMGGMGSYYY